MSFVRCVCVCPASSIFVELEVCPFDAFAYGGECFAKYGYYLPMLGVGHKLCAFRTSIGCVVKLCAARYIIFGH
jgi:hypothetical protein